MHGFEIDTGNRELEGMDSRLIQGTGNWKAWIGD
jgi:hypothetical protein